MAIVVLEDFAAYLRRNLDEFDAYTARMLIDGASELVTEYCGWHISPVISETVVVDGTGTAVQTLPTLNLLSLDSVAENGALLNEAFIDWSTNGLMEKRGAGLWTRRRRGVVAGITHGYAKTPSWVLTLICAAAGRVMPGAGGGNGVVAQESSGGESITYAVPRPAAANVAPLGAVVLLEVEKRMLDRIAVPRST